MLLANLQLDRKILRQANMLSGLLVVCLQLALQFTPGLDASQGIDRRCQLHQFGSISEQGIQALAALDNLRVMQQTWSVELLG